MLRNTAISVARRLIDSGHQAFFAGGCVRDALLGQEPKDYDIATSATPDEVLSLFPQSDSIGAHFGVILVRVDRQPFEIATFRTDGSYQDGRHPESVTFSTAEDDAQRRDFTVNGLFQNPLTDEIIDYVGGLADLETRTLRAIGDPQQRFNEDALRLMRAVRFASVLDFKIESQTAEAIRSSSPQLAQISIERITSEFSKILASPRREWGVRRLVSDQLMTHIIPEVLDLIDCEQPPQWHPEGDVFEHSCIALGLLSDEADLTQALSVLLHDIGKPATYSYDEADQRIRFNGHDAVGATMSQDILRRLKYPNQVIDDVSFIVSRHMQFMNVRQMRVAKVKRFMSSTVFDKELELHRVDCASSNGLTENYDYLQEKAEEFSNEPLIPRPLVTGADLIERKLSPGPIFKELLTAIQTEQLEGRLTERSEALTYLDSLLENG